MTATLERNQDPVRSPRTFDPRQTRADFPVLARRIHGKPLAYLDSAATAQKPQSVIDAVARYYAEDYASVHRGVHLLSQRATEAYERSRSTVARFLGAASHEEIVFTRGTTESVNLVARSYLRPRLKPGDEILVTEMEHHSNIVPWQIIAVEAGARLVAVPVLHDGSLDLEAFAQLLNDRTKMVAIVHVSNVLGTVNPIRRIVRMAREVGAPILVDGAQSVQHFPVDVQELGCDFFAFSGHKLFGPTGIGALYARRELLDEMPPYQGGGGMIGNVAIEGTTYAPAPARFEAGTPHIEGALGLAAAIEYLETLDWKQVVMAEQELLSLVTRRLEAVPDLRIQGTADGKVGAVSFTLEGAHPHDVGTILDREGVAVRAGHHCCQPLMRRLGVPATVRASFALYNTIEDADALLTGLAKVREVLL